MTEKRMKRVWVQNVAVGVRSWRPASTWPRPRASGRTRRRPPTACASCSAAHSDAAYGVRPRPTRLSNWWRGTLVDAAYQNLHAARALMVDVYDDAEVAAEIPVAVARSQRTLHRDDPRRARSRGVDNRSDVQRRAFLRRVIKDGYDALDRQHERLRSFRNINLTLAVFIGVLVGATVVFVVGQPAAHPALLPGERQANGGVPQNCPTGSGCQPARAATTSSSCRCSASSAARWPRPRRSGTCAAPPRRTTCRSRSPCSRCRSARSRPSSASSRSAGTSCPGLSALDSQQQILAYALVLGFGQQVFTRSLDRKAQTLLNAIPSKEATVAPPARRRRHRPSRRTASPRDPRDSRRRASPDRAGLAGTAPPPLLPAGSIGEGVAERPGRPDFQPPPAEDDEARPGRRQRDAAERAARDHR